MILQRRISVLSFTVCGLYLIGLGLYFVLFRPALLPEDPRYIGSSLGQIQAALPGLERWLGHVFDVMGGFMAGAGLLTVLVATGAVSARQKGTAVILALAGLATVGMMSWTNFAIASDFKWLLVAPAVLWLLGICSYLMEGRR